MWSRVLISLLLLTLPGCVSVTISDHAPDPTVVNAKNGQECTTKFLFFDLGSATVEGAMKQGGITKVYKIEHDQDYFLIAGSYCTVVYGSGEEMLTPATTTTPRHDADPDSGYGYRQRK